MLPNYQLSSKKGTDCLYNTIKGCSETASIFESNDKEDDLTAVIDDDEPTVKYNLKKPFVTSKEVSFVSQIAKYESCGRIPK